MISTPKPDKANTGNYDGFTAATSTPIATPSGTPGSSGHKASFRATKLAKRARSFKEDIIEKISQMRSPNGPATTMAFRSHSPHSPKTRHMQLDKSESSVEISPSKELDSYVRQINVALKHFQDVIAKNKLEMLPGNGTIVLETVTAIHTALKQSVLDMTMGNQSSALGSATTLVYQSLAKLMKLCDDALLHGDKSETLRKENVCEVVRLVEDAISTLVKLAQEKLSDGVRAAPLQPRSAYGVSNQRYHVPHAFDVPGQRNSLPDIPLTPRERQILEQTSATSALVRNSHSTESILREPVASPPPKKPPLPDNNCCGDTLTNPPPIPPKRRSAGSHTSHSSHASQTSTSHKHVEELESGIVPDLLHGQSTTLDRVSLRSRSPDESSSLLSASGGSLDSVLNQSKDIDEELCALMDSTMETTDDAEVECTCNCGASEKSKMNKECGVEESAESAESYRLSGHSSGTAESGISSIRSSVQSFSASHVSAKSNCFQYNAGAVKITETSQTSEKMTLSRVVTMMNEKMESVTQMSELGDALDGIAMIDDDVTPPKLPLKQRSKWRERRPSQYENVVLEENEHLAGCSFYKPKIQSLTLNGDEDVHGEPPPLPPKKKHIMAYMEMFGNCSHSSNNDFLRHSIHTYNMMASSEWQNVVDDTTFNRSATMSAAQSCSFSTSSGASVTQTNNNTLSVLKNNSLSLSTSPPALPPKKNKQTKLSTATITPSVSPSYQNEPQYTYISVSPQAPGERSPRASKLDAIADTTATNYLEMLDVTDYLVFKRADEDGPDLRGGHPDALVMYATKSHKNEFKYQEAFLTTYRTFMQPLDLVQKLLYRYHFLIDQQQNDHHQQRAAKETFSLLVSVVSDLTISDLQEQLVQALMELVYHLICHGNLAMAKALRIKFLEKYTLKQLHAAHVNAFVTSINTSSRNHTLLDFKSEHIAEQMTHLDAELFMKIEIPEVLIWAQEQNEERSPNLTCFTEHFNKMSYWARTQILEQKDAKEREKYLVKFMKIMKHLRKINNFNSYLALLSALDSAPIRRLEWQKHITEGLKEFCALIDSSSSFRAYRQALADTQPPCIPYIGLVLQDLTFVYIGNTDLLADGSINFSKRWQQFNIVENMKRFKKCTYQFKKNERIIAFFNNFDDFLPEETMWQISESIKPRGTAKKS